MPLEATIQWMTKEATETRLTQRAAGSTDRTRWFALALIVAAQWVRSDRVEARRRDRQADRDGDAELAAYNAQLAQRRAAHEQAERTRAERAAQRARRGTPGQGG